MTLALLATNAYLRLAKRIRPLLGIPFGQKQYVLTILKQTEDEVRKSPRLEFTYPWFSDADLASERLSKQVRLSTEERQRIEAATSVLRAHVLANAHDYTCQGRSPPSPTDCFLLAFGMVRPAIVVTDDLGMHKLAEEFEIDIWHGHELLKKMLGAKAIDNVLIREIYTALENNDDLPRTWREAKHTAFKKLFGPAP
ncbi:MAG: hypothetical protein B7Y41_04915 [Hydrogenophilales bacterium 28-61-23]|nr:MAG: hypothetical protein B7Y41_04915 [Hydrogenophilales bacterium 28-61-23]